MPDETALPPEHREHPIAQAAKECYRCGEPIEGGEEHCPHCGRRLYRVCYCGWRIPVDAESCPQCHADWSGTMRVRRKSHRHRFSLRRMGSYALLGAAGALGVAGVVGWIVIQLAERALPAGTAVPPGFAAQLRLVGQGLADLVATVGERMAGLGAGLGLALLVLLAGAVVGGLLYLIKEDLLRLPRPRRAGRAARVRRRRVR